MVLVILTGKRMMSKKLMEVVLVVGVIKFLRTGIFTKSFHFLGINLRIMVKDWYPHQVIFT